MTQIMEAETVEIKKVSRIISILKFIKNNPTGIIGLLLVVTTILCAIFAPYIAPHDPGAASLGHRLDLPKWLDDTGKSQYLLGETKWDGIYSVGLYMVLVFPFW